MNSILANIFETESGETTASFLRKNLAFIGGLLIVVGLVFSPALQSIGVGMIFCSVFCRMPFRFEVKKEWFSIVLVAVLIISLLSGFYAENHVEYWKKIQVKLPFLLLAVGFISGPVFSLSKFKKILFVFSLTVFIAGVITMVNYFLHFSFINEQLLHSKPIYILYAVERPENKQVNHIYYSILLAFSIWACFYLFREKFASRKLGNILVLSMGVGLVVILHVIGARTGLFGFYASSIVAVLWYIIKEKKYLVGLIAALLLGLVFVSTYKLLPAWQNRVANTKEDLGREEEGKDINHYSISMRKAALKTAWKIYQNNPILGVGEGDLQDEMDRQYTADGSVLIKENRKLPHNQFLQTLTTTGIAGLLILILIFLLPLTRMHTWKNILFLAFLVICFCSFQVESVLERQVGITFFCFFYLAMVGMYPRADTRVSS